MEAKLTAHTLGFIEVDEGLIVQLLAELLCNQGPIELKQAKHGQGMATVNDMGTSCIIVANHITRARMGACIVLIVSAFCQLCLLSCIALHVLCLLLNELPYFIFKVEN